MRRSPIRSIAAIIAAGVGCAALAASSLAAQTKPVAGFSAGYTDIGPAVGLGGIGVANASFGGRFDHALKPLPELGKS